MTREHSSKKSTVSGGNESTGLDESRLHADPIKQFEKWFSEALASAVPEADAMTLATSTEDGRPSARIVLLKGFDASGIVFYTNYESRKGRELEENPRAALVFYWQPMKRQVRIEGKVEKASAEESEAYFQSRPVGARLGAWASRQSETVKSRRALETRFEEFAKRFREEVPRPQHWGGYRLRPTEVEFWQGRANRLHDRIRYRLQKDGSWRMERLAP